MTPAHRPSAPNIGLACFPHLITAQPPAPDPRLARPLASTTAEQFRVPGTYARKVVTACLLVFLNVHRIIRKRTEIPL